MTEPNYADAFGKLIEATKDLVIIYIRRGYAPNMIAECIHQDNMGAFNSNESFITAEYLKLPTETLKKMAKSANIDIEKIKKDRENERK